MTDAAGSYDLLTRRSNWKAQAALIVSPYVEKHFFQKVAGDLCPKRMHVVIDDGCRRDDLQTVHDAVNACGRKRPPTLRCKLGSARGLVHIKLFYVLWKTPGGRAAHSLVFGSANATRQGFSGIDNAELVVSTKLTSSRHAAVIRWCKAVIKATEAAKAEHVPMERDAELARGMFIRLPAMTVGRPRAALSNFDLWLQRGWLLSDFRPDPGFLHVQIQLGKGLPQTELARIAEGAGFAVRQTKTLRKRYVEAPIDFDDEDNLSDEFDTPEIGNWRRKLFTWTNLGDWCSEACFEAHEKDFKRRGHEDRLHALEQLKALRNTAEHRTTKKKFLADIANLWDRFGEAAPTLLKGKEGALHRDFYEELFEQRVKRDLELAEDREFCCRFTRGFELIQVPRFRNDVAGWRSFVESLGRQLILDETRGRSQSMLLKAVREALKDKAGTSMWHDHRVMIEALREQWQRGGPSARGATIIAHYHAPTST